MAGVPLDNEIAQDAVGNAKAPVQLGGELRAALEVNQSVVALGLLRDGIGEAALPPIVNTFNSTVLRDESLELVHQFRAAFFPELRGSDDNDLVQVLSFCHFVLHLLLVFWPRAVVLSRSKDECSLQGNENQRVILYRQPGKKSSKNFLYSK